jgi:hypothetical protein
MDFEWRGAEETSSFLFVPPEGQRRLRLSPNSTGADEGERAVTGSVGLTALGMDFRRLDFEFDGERSRWTFGLGRRTRLGGAPRSFFGGGLALHRFRTRGELDEIEGKIKDFGLKPWVGGCLNCTLVDALQFGLEFQLVPGSVSAGGDNREGAEQRAAFAFGIEW